MKKLLGIVVLGLLLSSNAYAEQIPKLICEVIEDGKVTSSVTHDFNNRLRYNVNLSSNYIVYNYTESNDDGNDGKIEGEINRATGYWNTSITFDNDEKYAFTGKCKTFKANLF